MRFLRALLLIVLVLVAATVAAVVGARFADGPVAILAGGPLVSGELVTDPVDDWTFATDVSEIELQLIEPPRSRTVWIVVHEGKAYIPCGFLKVPLWKQWPHEAVADGRALVRIDGKIYPLQVVKVEDPDLHMALSGLAAAKYGYASGSAGPPGNDEVWYFRLDPRPAES